jgi:hypothetical protein
MGLDYWVPESIPPLIFVFEPVSAGFNCLFGKVIDFSSTVRVLLCLWFFYLFVNNLLFTYSAGSGIWDSSVAFIRMQFTQILFGLLQARHRSVMCIVAVVTFPYVLTLTNIRIWFAVIFYTIMVQWSQIRLEHISRTSANPSHEYFIYLHQFWHAYSHKWFTLLLFQFWCLCGLIQFINGDNLYALW